MFRMPSVLNERWRTRWYHHPIGLRYFPWYMMWIMNRIRLCDVYLRAMQRLLKTILHMYRMADLEFAGIYNSRTRVIWELLDTVIVDWLKCDRKRVYHFFSIYKLFLNMNNSRETRIREFQIHWSTPFKPCYIYLTWYITLSFKFRLLFCWHLYRPPGLFHVKPDITTKNYDLHLNK